MQELLNIQEPQINQEEKSIVFGIDLGTTHSLIAMIDNSNEVKIIADKNGKDLIPSVVYHNHDQIIVGNEVDKNNTSAIFSIKRFMGNAKNCTESLTPVKASAEILKKLCSIVKESVNLEVRKAVITVPAYFDESARKDTKDAASIAGIEVLRLLSEPTAAALAYNIDDFKDQEICAVYDLGGGTFDISILKLHRGVFQVLSTGGDTHLGGDDIDHKIVSFILNKYKISKNIAELSINNDILRPLLNQACEIKKSLSIELKVSANVNINKENFTFTITRNDLKDIATELIDKTMDIVFKTISDANITHNDINKIILVGGSTKLFLIKERLREIFHNKVLDNVDAERIVVMGAALQANYLSSDKVNNRKLVIDVLPLSLGIETFGGIVEKLIPRNSPIPAYSVQEFTTQIDGQNAIQIHICQGERDIISHNKSLAKFDLKGITPLPAGKARVKVEFRVDVDGLLTVKAFEEMTGISQTIEVNSSYGLTEHEIKEKILDSIKYFDEDKRLCEITRAKTKAQYIISKIIDAINKDPHLLIDSELKVINEEIKKAEEMLDSDNNDLNKIQKAINEVESKSSLFLQKRMDYYFKQSTDGYNTEDNKCR